MPMLPLRLLILILLLAFLLAFIQVGLLSVAFEKLGLSVDSGLMLLFSALCGSLINPIPRLGIAMPVLIAPLTAALVAVAMDIEHSAPLAYISGTLGVLIGADLLRLKDVRPLGAPIASIGGAGTFDGIFMTGIVAALLA
jgi:uncharacterized membrane protein